MIHCINCKLGKSYNLDVNMLKRKAEQDIINWIDNQSKEALLVSGARQIGKTFLIRATLNKKGCEYLEFNLLKDERLRKSLEACASPQDFMDILTLYATKPFTAGRTIVFVDEVQECKNFITYLKFLVDETPYRFILSGSLLGVSLYGLSSAPMGYLHFLKMHPLNFEEFLWALGVQEEGIAKLREHYEKKVPYGQNVVDFYMYRLYLYLIIGGMPEAVDSYVKEKSLNKISVIHQSIIANYRLDFTKYLVMYSADRSLLNVDTFILRKIYDLIPAELGKKNRRFYFKDIGKGAPYLRYEDEFLWLAEADVALPTYNLREPKIPFYINHERSLFKLFEADVGMLSSSYGREFQKKILAREFQDMNVGAVMENYFAMELYSKGFPLYYYSNKKIGEIDFLIVRDGRPVPLEIKSGGNRFKHQALLNLFDSEPSIKEAYVFANTDIVRKDRIIYLPLFCSMFLGDGNEDTKLPDLQCDEMPLLQ